MRYVLALGLAACTGCGDNAPVCGHVELLNANRNIWGGHIAVDDALVYYSDYDNGIGTRLVFRQPRDGGQALVIGAREQFSRFGYGMAVDSGFLYWAAELDPIGYALFETPTAGGRTFDLTTVSVCTVTAVAIDAFYIYAAALRCSSEVEDRPARVVAVSRAVGGATELWSSFDADVSAIAPVNGDIVIGTTAGLVRVSALGTTLLDGRATYHVEIDNDEIVYSTEEEILAQPVTGGAPRTRYTFRTPVDQPRAFATDGGDLYISEPPELIYLADGGTPMPIVNNMGAAITHITARDGAAYWATLAMPESLGLLGTFSGGVLKVHRPCP